MATDTATESATTAPARVLVVDDERSMRELLTIVLKRDGYEVLVADDGRAGDRAAEEAARRHPDHRHPDAADERRRRPARGQEHRPRDHQHRHDRVRVDRHRGRGAAARRRRLRPQVAERGQRAAAAGAQGARAQAPAAGERAAQARAAERAQVLEHHRPQRADAGGVPADRDDRADRQHRADHRRVGHRQGARGARDPLQLARGRTGRSSRSTAARCRKRCSTRSSSAT